MSMGMCVEHGEWGLHLEQHGHIGLLQEEMEEGALEQRPREAPGLPGSYQKEE